jgi:hypothetical protein
MKTLVINTAKTYNLAFDKLMAWAEKQGDDVEGFGRDTVITANTSRAGILPSKSTSGSIRATR